MSGIFGFFSHKFMQCFLKVELQPRMSPVNNQRILQVLIKGWNKPNNTHFNEVEKRGVELLRH